MHINQKAGEYCYLVNDVLPNFEGFKFFFEDFKLMQPDGKLPYKGSMGVTNFMPLFVESSLYQVWAPMPGKMEILYKFDSTRMLLN